MLIMRQRRFCILLSLVMVFVLMGTACSSGTTSTSAPNKTTYDYNIGASATSGMSYRWVVPMCEVVNKYSDLVTLNPITTTGSTENVNLILSGEAELGVGPASTVYNAVNGLVDWKGKPAKGIEYVYFMFPDYFNIFLPEKSPVNSLSDLKGRTISLGETGSGGYTNNVAALTALGYSLSDFKVVNISLADSPAAIAEGWLEGLIYYGSPNMTAIAEMQVSPTGLKMIELTEEEVRKACAANPIFVPRTLTKSYPGIPPLRTFGGSTAVFGREDIPDEVTYEIAKVINEHVDEIAEVFDYAKESTIENCVGAVTIVPTAGGTLQYMREKGLVK